MVCHFSDVHDLGRTKYLRLMGEPDSIPGRVTPDFRMWESCWTMPLVSGFSQGTPVSPVLSFRRCSILMPVTLIGSQDLDVKSNPNLFTQPKDKNNGQFLNLRVARLNLVRLGLDRCGVSKRTPISQDEEVDWWTRRRNILEVEYYQSYRKVVNNLGLTMRRDGEVCEHERTPLPYGHLDDILRLAPKSADWHIGVARYNSPEIFLSCREYPAVVAGPHPHFAHARREREGRARVVAAHPIEQAHNYNSRVVVREVAVSGWIHRLKMRQKSSSLLGHGDSHRIRARCVYRMFTSMVYTARPTNSGGINRRLAAPARRFSGLYCTGFCSAASANGPDARISVQIPAEIHKQKRRLDRKSEHCERSTGGSACSYRLLTPRVLSMHSESEADGSTLLSCVPLVLSTPSDVLRLCCLEAGLGCTFCWVVGCVGWGLGVSRHTAQHRPLTLATRSHVVLAGLSWQQLALLPAILDKPSAAPGDNHRPRGTTAPAAVLQPCLRVYRGRDVRASVNRRERAYAGVPRQHCTVQSVTTISYDNLLHRWWLSPRIMRTLPLVYSVFKNET
ncbi:hypothetical protein PR048_002495 [Dryococelus australis]|uniref:Uncharacterized protein n=1 Tax=Dryococelus australis TaxID=614101 RepID=A0ABQ9IKF3_9NEOP|nr:hypothetical protein PR048_002495 [Dryococelus australis]